MSALLHDLSGRFDAIVIGGGVVGCALCRKFALEGARVVLIEKAADILDGASKANSAILHTGFDAPPGSLEAACIAAGHSEYLAIRERLGLPLIRSGALVLAWSAEEAAALAGLIEQAGENGVRDIEPLSGAQTLALEPALAPGVVASFRVPGESLIDPWSAPLAYLTQAMEHGARIVRSCEVTGGTFDGAYWRLQTTRGPIEGKMVVNATGLFGDLIDRKLIGGSDFSIRPRKGQFIVFDKPAAALARHILLPVPGKLTKGVVVCRTVFGNLIVGPTAEEQDDRETAGLTREALLALRMRGEQIVPALKAHDVTAIYAGLRPASEFKDYRIRAHDRLNYVSVGAIRSTGLSAALGIARHVFALCQPFGLGVTPPAEIRWPRIANISEAAPRDWQAAGHGGVVCHCELVTRREIEAALSGPLPAASLAGLKRRTRVTMGRCQGFYCTAELARITAGRFACPMAEPVHGG